MDGKTKIIIILSLILAIILSLGIFWTLEKRRTTIIPQVPTVDPELAIIDSLSSEIEKKEQEIAELREEIKQKKVIVVKEIEKIKELPTDESVELMKENLRKHGELGDPLDTFPKIIALPDTAVLLSQNNVKDVNIISKKLENSLEVCDLLEKEVALDSLILERKDSIISEQSIMFRKQETIHQVELQGLERSLKEQKKKNTTTAIVLGGTVAVSLTITGFVLAKALGK